MKHLRWMLIDSLTHAIAIASRCVEASGGTEDIFLFEAARSAIFELRDDNPAMKALMKASQREFEP